MYHKRFVQSARKYLMILGHQKHLVVSLPCLSFLCCFAFCVEPVFLPGIIGKSRDCCSRESLPLRVSPYVFGLF